MILIVIPVVDIRMIAAKTLSGMLTAATMVERRFSKKTKITTTAKAAPRPPSLTSELMESMMKVEESVTTDCFTCAECAAANFSIAAIES